MACCGQRRAALTPSAPRTTTITDAQAATRTTGDTSLAYFQYTGATALTAIGSVTRTRYRFARTGAIVAVDPRDRRSVAAIRSLRQVYQP